MSRLLLLPVCVHLQFPSSYASKGPFLGSVDGSGVWWVVRLPLASGDSGNWCEFFKVSKALNVPILVAFQAGTPAVTAENSMNDAATITSVSGWVVGSWLTVVGLLGRWVGLGWAHLQPTPGGSSVAQTNLIPGAGCQWQMPE